MALPVLLAGCEAEAVELARDIEAARGDCTAEGLRRTDEECVRMMERYAGMGTELVHTYIGGLKALDMALERMPPPAFDTAGLGYALSPQFRSGDGYGEGASPRLAPGPVRSSLAPTAAPAYALAPGERTASRSTARGRTEAREGGGVWQRGYGAYRRSPAAGRRRDDARSRAERRERIDDRRRSAPFGYGGGWWGYGDAYRYLESGPEGYFNGGPYGYFYNGYYGSGYGIGFGDPRGYRFGYGIGRGYGYADPGWSAPYGAYGYGPGYGYADPAWNAPYGGYGYGPGYGYADPAWDAPYGGTGYGYGYMPGGYDGYGDRGYGAYGDGSGGYGPDPYEYTGEDPGDPRYDGRPPIDRAYADGDGRPGMMGSGAYPADDARQSEARTPAEDWGYAPVQAGALSATEGAPASAARTPPRPAPHRPGILLPPEERLRRPWLDD